MAASDDTRDVQFSFAGEAAMTANRYALEHAVELLAGGADPEAVRQQTGWHQWVDGKWRFEISDADARLKNLRMDDAGVAMRATSLGELLEHGALYAAYPELAILDAQITIAPGKQLAARFIEPTTGDAVRLGNSAQIDVTAPTAEDALSALLHEVQHYIQMREGFSPGGSIKTSDAALPSSVVAEIGRIIDLASEHSLRGEYKQAWDLREEVFQMRRREGFAQYRRLAGEVEARNTEARRALTDAERRELPPSETADYSDEEVVLSGVSGVSFKEGVVPGGRAQADMFGEDFARKTDVVQTDVVISSRGDRLVGRNEDHAGRQIAQTKQGLENFWRWFGDSAASKDGVPLLLYHSTNADFTQFKTGIATTNTTNFGDVETQRHAIFATPDLSLSETYFRPGDGKNVMPVYMSIKNPLVLTQGLNEADANLIVEASGGGISHAELAYFSPGQAWEFFDGEFGRKFVEAARRAGFDGAVVLELHDEGDAISYAAFDAVQVKSAIGNLGRFDPQSPDILQSQMPDALARWAGATKTLNQDGSLKVFYHGTSQDFSVFSNEAQTRGSMGSSVGFYFTESAQAASHYGDSSDGGRVMPVYLKMEKPMVFDSKQINREALSQLLGVDLRNVYGIPERAEVYWFFKNGGAYDGRDSARVGDAVVAAAKAKGYDGVVFKESINGEVVDVHLVFDATQVKSAIGNRGEYNPQSDDILRSVDLDAVSVSFNGVVAPRAPTPANIRSVPAVAVDDVQRVRAAVLSVLGSQAAERVLGGGGGVLSPGHAGLLVVRSGDLAGASGANAMASPMASVLTGQWVPAGVSTILSEVVAKESFVSYLQMLRDGQAPEAEGDLIVLRDGSNSRWRAIEFDRPAGSWTVRPFDAEGVGAPQLLSSLDEAIALCTGDGYSIRDDSALARMAGTRAFQRQALNQRLGRQVKSGEISQGRAREILAAHDRTQTALAVAAASSAQAYYHPAADTIVLVADRIAPGDEAAVYLHEVVHRSGRAAIGQAGWDRLVGRVKGWESRQEGEVEREIYRRAYARATAAVGQGHRHYDEELFAYSVEEAVRLGVKPSLTAHEDSAEAWLADVVATLEGVIYQSTQSVQSLNAQQLVNLAYALAQLESPERARQVREALAKSRAQRDAAMEDAAHAPAAPAPAEWRVYEGLEKAVEALPVAVADSGAWSEKLSALVTEGAISEDDLFWSGLQDWLDLRGEVVAKDDLLGYLRGNTLQIQESAMKESRLIEASAKTEFAPGVGAGKFDNRIALNNRDPLGYYSALARGIEGMQTKTATADGWKAQIKGLLNKGAIKAEELEWTGLEDWLDLQEGKIAKGQVLVYLQGNGVKVQEVVLGQPSEADIEALLNDELGEGMSREDAIEYLSKDEGATPTKYSQYTLPGGENYREILLTLPRKMRPVTLAEVNAARAKISTLLEPVAQDEYARMLEEGTLALVDADAAKNDYRSRHWDLDLPRFHGQFEDSLQSLNFRRLCLGLLALLVLPFKVNG